MTTTPEFGFPRPSDQTRISTFPKALRDLSDALEARLPAAAAKAARLVFPGEVTRQAASILTTATDALKAANAALTTARNTDGRVSALESAAGFGPSSPTDGTMASLIQQASTQTRSALAALFAPASTRADAAADAAALIEAELRASRWTADVPATTGAGIRPALPEGTALGAWGSSSMEQTSLQGLAPLVSSMGFTRWFNGGRSGERSEHIAARLGSVPAQLVFPSGTIPASGAVAVTAKNMRPTRSLKAFTGVVSGVAGTLSSTSDTLTFTRTTAGEAVASPAGAPFVPDLGTSYQRATSLLWLGKNDQGDPVDATVARVDASFNYGPIARRALVLGHFLDRGTTAAERARVTELNALHEARYGRLFMDFHRWVTSQDVWDALGIRPTPQDRDEQARGELPASAATDAAHMSPLAYRVTAERIWDRMAELGWVPARPAPTIADGFNRADAATLGTASDGTSSRGWVTVPGGGTLGVTQRAAAVRDLAGKTWAAAVLGMGTADGTMEVVASGPNEGLLFRVANDAGYSFLWSGGNNVWRLTSFPASVEVARATVSTAPTPGTRIRVALAGTRIRCYVDGVQVIDVTDTRHTGATHGIVSLNANSTHGLDNFKWWNP